MVSSSIGSGYAVCWARIRGTQRGLNLSGVALIKATNRLARPNKKYQNIFDKVKKEHEETIKQLELLKYEAKKQEIQQKL